MQPACGSKLVARPGERIYVGVTEVCDNSDRVSNKVQSCHIWSIWLKRSFSKIWKIWYPLYTFFFVKYSLEKDAVGLKLFSEILLGFIRKNASFAECLTFKKNYHKIVAIQFSLWIIFIFTWELFEGPWQKYVPYPPPPPRQPDIGLPKWRYMAHPFY